MKKTFNKDFYTVGEYFSGNTDSLLAYLDYNDQISSLFDAPLHFHFMDVSAIVTICRIIRLCRRTGNSKIDCTNWIWGGLAKGPPCVSIQQYSCCIRIFIGDDIKDNDGESNNALPGFIYFVNSSIDLATMSQTVRPLPSDAMYFLFLSLPQMWTKDPFSSWSRFWISFPSQATTLCQVVSMMMPPSFDL